MADDVKSEMLRCANGAVFDWNVGVSQGYLKGVMRGDGIAGYSACEQDQCGKMMDFVFM